MHRVPLIGLVILVTLLVGACSNSATTAPSAASPGGAPGAQSVTIQNFSFQPTSLTVRVGSTVTWTNKDGTGHTVTADDGSFKSNTIRTGTTYDMTGTSFKQTFTKAGTYSYHCSIHTSMKGTITVK